MSINEKSKESGEQDNNANEDESELEQRKLMNEQQHKKFEGKEAECAQKQEHIVELENKLQNLLADFAQTRTRA